MKGILMLFKDPDRTSTEEFIILKLKKVEITSLWKVYLINCIAKE